MLALMPSSPQDLRALSDLCASTPEDRRSLEDRVRLVKASVVLLLHGPLDQLYHNH